MNARCAGLALVLVAAILSPATSTQARPSDAVAHLNGNVDILVNGTPVPRYAHGGRWYVEALKGREYAVRLRNPYPVSVAVALSVDGLNTIDARETTAKDASKWVIEPYQTITISGWQTSASEARRFEFTTEERSYGAALGRTANLGIISAVFFRERSTPAVIEDRRDRSSRQEPAAPAPSGGAPARESAADASSSRAKVEGEYAATGMGRRTDHAVTRIRLDLEPAPAHSVNIRYEFRPQLVRLGILPSERAHDPLDRRERSRGFDQEFSPVPPALR
jgi:hypothetical protein